MRLNLNIVFSAFLLCSAYTPPALTPDTIPRPRLISVTGTAEVNVAPDEAVLSLGVESRDKDLAIAKAQHDHRVKKLLAEAHDAGVEGKYIQTSMLQMRPDYSEERVPRLLAYQVSQTIQVTLKDLSKYERLISKLLEAGVNRVDSVEFLVAEPRKYKDEARAKAIKAAREKAVAMAAELGQTIGKPWDISEEGFNGLFGQTNYSIQMNRSVQASSYAYNGSSTAEESTVAPGEVSIRASVRVSFQLE